MIALDHPWLPEGQRAAFRVLLDAWAKPGTIADLSPWTGNADAAVAVLAALCDPGTTLADVHGRLRDGERGRLGAWIVAPSEAAFLLADGTREPGDLAPSRGTLLAPELGATVILDGARFGTGPTQTLTGPGIPGTTTVAIDGLAAGWWTARDRWCAFPLGVDLVLCAGTQVICLPRHTRIGG